MQEEGESRETSKKRRHGEVASSDKQRHEDVAKPTQQRHEDVAKFTRQRHDDVAKPVSRRQVTQSSSLRESEDGSDDEASLASLAMLLRGEQAPSTSSYRRDDDANSSQIRDEDVISSDQVSLIEDDHISDPDSDEVSLDEEVLSLFGKSVIQASDLSPPIQKDLSEIWAGILNTGLGDEERQELLRKFPHPENCRSLAPPKLNPLVISASSESVVRRDKRLCDMQAQISAAISAIGLAVTTLLKRGGGRDVGAIKQLGEAGRLLTDLFHQETVSRRELAALNLNKTLKATLLDVPNDEWLFGKDLEERVKSHKNLAQSSKDLKDGNIPASRSSSSSHPKRPLNFKSSPRRIQGLRRGGRQQYQQPRRDYKSRESRDKWPRKPERQGSRTGYHR